MSMGGDGEELFPLGGIRLQGRRTSKEADAAFMPESRTAATDWPLVVFESGLSESSVRLRGTQGGCWKTQKVLSR